ncbi:MAG: hypothetical protein IH993_04335, partial [Proteobacteria bacterium]|nr:hypothetical protein [Pseudomonadota bacterium]
QEGVFLRGLYIDPAFIDDMKDGLAEPGEEGFSPLLYVYDKSNGELLREIALPAFPQGAPATYMAGGKQFIVVPVGGGPGGEAELIALALQ